MTDDQHHPQWSFVRGWNTRLCRCGDCMAPLSGQTFMPYYGSQIPTQPYLQPLPQPLPVQFPSGTATYADRIGPVTTCGSTNGPF